MQPPSSDELPPNDQISQQQSQLLQQAQFLSAPLRASPSVKTGGESCATIECPKSMVGRVIGKNGETIKALQLYTSSLIQVNQMTDPCQITISGTPQSLSLAVSMVADIVKGTFKGFALLRQLVGNPRPPPTYQMPPINAVSRPVYAPGYGLIPTSQLYGGDDISAPFSQGNVLPHGLVWSPAAVSSQPMVMGLPHMGQPLGQPNAMLGASMPGHLRQPVYGSIPNAAAYGGITYYPAHKMPGVSGTEPALLYQDASGTMYSTTSDASSGQRFVPGSRQSPYLGGAGLGDHAAGASGAVGSSGAKLLQATSAAGSRSTNITSAAGNWLPHPTVSGGSSTIVSDLIGESSGPASQQIPVAVGGGAPAAGPGGAQGGNLVMDVDGKFYYVNTV